MKVQKAKLFFLKNKFLILFMSNLQVAQAAEDAISFLCKRQEFWRQFKPMYSEGRRGGGVTGGARRKGSGNNSSSNNNSGSNKQQVRV